MTCGSSLNSYYYININIKCVGRGFLNLVLRKATDTTTFQLKAVVYLVGRKIFWIADFVELDWETLMNLIKIFQSIK